MQNRSHSWTIITRYFEGLLLLSYAPPASPIASSQPQNVHCDHLDLNGRNEDCAIKIAWASAGFFAGKCTFNHFNHPFCRASTKGNNFEFWTKYKMFVQAPKGASLFDSSIRPSYTILIHLCVSWAGKSRIAGHVLYMC